MGICTKWKLSIGTEDVRQEPASVARRCRRQEAAADAGDDVLITVRVWPPGLGACVEEDDEEKDDEEEDEEGGGRGS